MTKLRLRCPEGVEVMSSDDADWLNDFRAAVSTVVQPSTDIGRIGQRCFFADPSPEESLRTGDAKAETSHRK